MAARVRPPVLAACVLSRALVLLAGAAGAEAAWRPGWTTFDPGELSRRLGALGTLLGGAAVRWDAIHYLQIAAHGYTTPTSTVFFPLYPLLVHVGGWILGSPEAAGMAISLAAFALALLLLRALTTLECGASAAGAAVVLLAFAPLSFFFGAVYSESLFLALSVGSFYAARTGRWPIAVGLAALAAVTRVPGILLVVPLAILAWPERSSRWRRMLSLTAVPAALLAYMGYLALHGLSPMAPFTSQSAWRYSTGPVDAVALAARWALSGVRALLGGAQPFYEPTVRGPLSAGAESIVLLLQLGAALVALKLAWRRLPRAYAAYCAAAIVVCLWNPGAQQPLMSFDRFLLTFFPLWMVAGAWLAGHERLRIAVTMVGAALLAFFSFQFATWAFIA